MKIDIKILEEYKERKLISSARHPALPLNIWAYTVSCQYGQVWDEITLMCRGLVTDDSGNVVAKPFPKFFNMEERRHQPTKSYQVYEKLDGTLGIMFNYQGQWVFATKKCFDSEYVTFFQEMMLSGYTAKGEPYSNVLQHLHPSYTYLFELIHPDFKIVVDYEGKEELILIGAHNNDTGEEVEPEIELARLSPFIPVVKRFQSLETETLRYMKELNAENQEGFVVRFSNGQRCKIKFQQYVHLHALITGTSNLSIWRMLKDGQDFDEEILSHIPDELYGWITEVKEKLQAEYDAIVERHRGVLTHIREKEYSTRKEFALEVIRICEEKDAFKWLVFSLDLEHKDYTERLWKQVKPEHETYWG